MALRSEYLKDTSLNRRPYCGPIVVSIEVSLYIYIYADSI